MDRRLGNPEFETEPGEREHPDTPKRLDDEANSKASDIYWDGVTGA